MDTKYQSTQYHGVVLEVGDNPGGYEADGLMTKLPHVSGEGGFGAEGEYKKYPEMKIVHCNAESGSIVQVGSGIVKEVSFLPSPSKDSLIAPGGESTAGKASSLKKTRKAKQKDTQKVPTNVVEFEGMFGKVSAPYETVDRQGFMLILVADTSSDFVYTPPESEDAITVTYDGGSIQAYSSGIVFAMPGTSKRVIVLLLETEE